MLDSGLTFSADAVLHAGAAIVNNELVLTIPKSYTLDLGREEILTALKKMGMPTQRFKIAIGAAAAAPRVAPAEEKPAGVDEATERALGHPDVQKFRELFGGEVRTVRNLKES
jgi:hypothetical protein